MKNNVLRLALLSILAFFAVDANAQVKIGNNPTTITSSSVLDIESTNKGVIFPRVALSSATDNSTIASPVAGLMVYNTGAGSLSYKGYVFWDGSVWKKLDGSDIPNGDASNGDATITASATVGPLVSTTDGILKSDETPGNGYHRFVTSPDGKFSVRVKIEEGYPFGWSDLEIRSNVGTPTIIWNGSTMFRSGQDDGGVYVMGNNGTRFPSQGIWYGNGRTGNGDGNDITTFNKQFGGAWGDIDIFYQTAEWRRYSWTSSDTNDKTIYVAYIMLGAPDDDLIANAANCPNGICQTTKAYIRIEQIKTAD